MRFWGECCLGWGDDARRRGRREGRKELESAARVLSNLGGAMKWMDACWCQSDTRNAHTHRQTMPCLGVCEW
jgi:hypothetical protein